MATTKSENVHFLSPKPGQATVTAKPTVTEREIVEARDNIIQTLHAAYLTLNDSMAEFQNRWDANPMLAMFDGAIEGAADGGSTWLADQADLFEKENWKRLGNQVETFAGSCIDAMANYSRKQYKDLEREVNRLVANPEKTLHNWAWWQNKFEEHAGSQQARVRELHAKAQQTVRAVAAGADRAQKIYKHRTAIMNLPSMVARADVKGIQAFVEKELMEIDEKLALEIRGDKRFAIVIEVLADPESVLTYLAYASLMIEAIPPNFIAYIAGKGAMYLIIELVLLLVTALISAGGLAAARIGALVARIAMTSAKVSGATKVYKGAKHSVAGFVRAVEDLETAVKGLHELGPKIMRARSRDAVAKGPTETNIPMKREIIKRDKRCRICGSPNHSTPRTRRGTVDYE